MDAHRAKEQWREWREWYICFYSQNVTANTSCPWMKEKWMNDHNETNIVFQVILCFLFLQLSIIFTAHRNEIRVTGENLLSLMSLHIIITGHDKYCWLHGFWCCFIHTIQIIVDMTRLPKNCTLTKEHQIDLRKRFFIPANGILFDKCFSAWFSNEHHSHHFLFYFWVKTPVNLNKVFYFSIGNSDLEFSVVFEREKNGTKCFLNNWFSNIDFFVIRKSI